MQRLYDLVVIDRNRPELGVKFGQLGAILDRCFLHFHHPERLAEQPGSDETGLARNARLLPLREEAGVLPVVQVKDMAMLRRVCEGGADEDYKRMAYEQFTRLGKKAYPVLCSSPEKAIATADEHIAAGHVPDIVFFDLPGTVNSEGVINSLAGMDYIFTPISADKVVLESSLSFAMAIQKLLVKNEACRLAGLYLFWNMVDGREKTDLYAAYDKTIKELELPLMRTFIPDTKRYKKELVADRKAVFRSTLFPASRPLVRGSNLEELITEIVYYIKLQ